VSVQKEKAKRIFQKKRVSLLFEAHAWHTSEHILGILLKNLDYIMFDIPLKELKIDHA